MRDQLDCLNVARNAAKYANVSIKLKTLLLQSHKRHSKSITVSTMIISAQFTFWCVRNVSDQALI